MPSIDTSGLSKNFCRGNSICVRGRCRCWLRAQFVVVVVVVFIVVPPANSITAHIYFVNANVSHRALSCSILKNSIYIYKNMLCICFMRAYETYRFSSETRHRTANQPSQPGRQCHLVQFSRICRLVQNAYTFFFFLSSSSLLLLIFMGGKCACDPLGIHIR